MQRKVIQIANSTQLISLPRKWAIKHGIKKGDELDVEEKGNKIIINSGKSIVLNKVELNITNMDRSSIMYYLRSVYRLGYDEIEIKFDNTTTTHFRLNKKVSVLSILHEEVNRLVGVEIVRQTENLCSVKDISTGSIKEFDIILRRIFLLLKDASNDLVNAIEKKDNILLETIEQKHDTITKFVSYCLRLINKYGYHDSRHTTTIYHIIETIDKVIDIIKYVARDVLFLKPTIKKNTKEILEAINQCILNYIELFYKFEIEKVGYFMKKRDKAVKSIKTNLRKMSPEEIKVVTNLEAILEILLDLVEAKMSLEH